MVLNTCEMWSNGTEIAFFFKKIPKSCLLTGGSVPRSPSLIRLNKLIYLHKSPNLDIFIFNFWFKPIPFRKLSVKCQSKPRLLIFHSTISLSNKNFSSKISDDFIARDFWFAPPPIKNSGYAYARGMAFLAVSPQITGWAPHARVNFCSSTTSKLLPKNR